MFNVIIIDDEPFIINSLLSSIHWQSLNLNVIGTFSNSSDALEFIHTHTVHLILTDIRMPGLSGLDLCNHIYHNYPHIQVIIISGYADFAYAQKAIRYNVLGYCVKPLDFDEITLLLRKAIVNNSSKDLLSYDVLDALENHDMEFLNTYFSEHHIHTSSIHIMISIGPNPLPTQLSSTHTTIKLGPHKYMYLSNLSFNHSNLSPDLLNDLKIKGIGIYPSAISLDILQKTIYKTILMAYQFFFFGAPYLCNTLTSSTPTHLIVTIKQILATQNLSDIEALLIDLKSSTNLSTYNINFALKIYNLFITYYSGCYQLELEDNYMYSIEDLYTKFGCFTNMIDSLSNNFSEQITPIDLPTTHNNTFIYVLQFINHNYMNNISLSDISNHLNLNQSYISQLFKKETGFTYTSYLSQLRIEKAKQLLLKDELSLNDISELVGFNDYFYFLKTFKKLVGISPGKYKAQGGSVSNYS